MTEGVYKMQLKFALATFALLGSLHSVSTLANEIDLNLVCSYSSKTEWTTNQYITLEPKHYTGTMGVRIERKVYIENKVLIKIETLGEKRIQFIIWVPVEPDSSPVEWSESDWGTLAGNDSTETLLDFFSYQTRRIGKYTSQDRIFKIDRVTGIMQGTIINNYSYSTDFETTSFYGSCQRADPSKRLF